MPLLQNFLANSQTVDWAKLVWPLLRLEERSIVQLLLKLLFQAPQRAPRRKAFESGYKQRTWNFIERGTLQVTWRHKTLAGFVLRVRGCLRHLAEFNICILDNDSPALYLYPALWDLSHEHRCYYQTQMLKPSGQVVKANDVLVLSCTCHRKSEGSLCLRISTSMTPAVTHQNPHMKQGKAQGITKKRVVSFAWRFLGSPPIPDSGMELQRLRKGFVAYYLLKR